MVAIEPRGPVNICMYDNSLDRHSFAGRPRPLDSIGQKHSAESFPLVSFVHGDSGDQRNVNGIPRKPLSYGLRAVLKRYLQWRHAVVADYVVRLLRMRSNPHRGKPFVLCLSGLAPRPIIEKWRATVESCAVALFIVRFRQSCMKSTERRGIVSYRQRFRRIADETQRTAGPSSFAGTRPHAI